MWHRWPMTGGERGEKDGTGCRQFFRLSVERARPTLCQDFKLLMNCKVYLFLMGAGIGYLVGNLRLVLKV